MSIPTETMDSAFKRRLRTAVLKWYDKHGRKLPWRNSLDPYRVWLSEIMLQQTTVAAVVPYFERFLARFPDVRALAVANVDEVLRLWEGLGYYSRARNLHKAARVILDEHGGEFPPDILALQTLPGIGRYTAAAIVSFAFNLPAAIVEANTERLYARLIGLQDDVRSTQSRKSLWKFADEIVATSRCGDFNQSLMDIGSQICRPVAPDCSKCPLVFCCNAFALGLQNELPVRKPKTPITAVTEVCIVIRQGDKVLLRRRSDQERWAGMWDFVRFEIDDSQSKSLLRERISADGGMVQEATVELLSNDQSSPSVAAGRKVPPGRRHLQELLREVPSGRQHLLELPRGMRHLQTAAWPSTTRDRIRAQTGLSPGFVVDSTEFRYSVTRYRVHLKCFLCGTLSATGKLKPGQHWFRLSELADLPLSKTGRQVADWVKRRIPVV